MTAVHTLENVRQCVPYDKPTKQYIVHTHIHTSIYCIILGSILKNKVLNTTQDHIILMSVLIRIRRRYLQDIITGKIRGGETMCRISTDQLQDCSSQSDFTFSLRCEECGKVWRSKPVRFSRAGVIAPSEGKRVIFETLLKREKESALRRAAGEAENVFSRCPICHRLVCDNCFLICEELDMCDSCAKRLKEEGSPVSLQSDEACLQTS